MFISVTLGVVVGNIIFKFLENKADRFIYDYKCDKILERKWFNDN